MSEFFECYFLWLLLGLLLGFLLFWLYDLLFRRNDDDNDTYGTDASTTTTEAQQFTAQPMTTASAAAAPVAAAASEFSLSDHIEMSDSSKSLAKEFGLKPQKSGKDDLTVVEGIGPKISQLLIDDGVETFRQLEKTEVSAIQKVLDDAGPSYKLAKPESWPKQSGLCVVQDWKELKEYQDRLFNGVEIDN